LYLRAIHHHSVYSGNFILVYDTGDKENPFDGKIYACMAQMVVNTFIFRTAA
jgi:hypothetical protein